MFRFVRGLLLLLTLLIPADLSAEALCGDCDLDGTVRVNELVESVANALSSSATPTPVPNRCPAFAAGARYTSPSGRKWVLVEVPVYLEDSTESFLLRYPVQLDEDGRANVSQTRITLSKTACPNGEPSCTPEQIASICGFATRIRTFVDTQPSGFYFESGTSEARKASLSFNASARAQYVITVDPEYAPVLVQIGSTASAQVAVTPVATYSYSFARASFPASGIGLRQLREDLETLQQYVSLRPAQ